MLQGLNYLYLTDADYQQLRQSVSCHALDVNGEKRWVIDYIIGAKDGLGVENLRGSGTIAGETSLAYDDIFTLTYVTARTVGIGAYLARLGQRVIQKQTLPIILTGHNALNKLLGKQVYTSNLQLGGPEIMYTNGVTHMVVSDDMEGVMAVLNWLSFVPACRCDIESGSTNIAERLNSALTHVQSADPTDRAIEFMPSRTAYDVRHMLAGVYDISSTAANGRYWQSGFFDRDSFVELLGGWAKSVVVGRARLGGIPMGVIAVETRTIEQIIPADPATPDSKEQIVQRAGQVWYPDSAYKTATGIRDMIAEDIPLIIFANWRGFSGGMRDMFDEILKFGSYIVDSLRCYRQPVFVYIPPFGTLRGGAWVVVDSTINSPYMEMYADESARGGVLETEGTLEVKFRYKDILATMHRLDSVLATLRTKLTAMKQSGDAAAVTALENEIRAREQLLYPFYHSVATLFADQHDHPGRMIAKGCIRAQINWREARTFFYWRLRRRLAELAITKQIMALQEQGAVAANLATPGSSSQQEREAWKSAQALLYSWISCTADDNTPNHDQLVLQAIQNNAAQIATQLLQLKQKSILTRVQAQLNTFPVADAPIAANGKMDASDNMVHALTQRKLLCHTACISVCCLLQPCIVSLLPLLFLFDALSVVQCSSVYLVTLRHS